LIKLALSHAYWLAFVLAVLDLCVLAPGSDLDKMLVSFFDRIESEVCKVVFYFTSQPVGMEFMSRENR
jgi:hypothetical protein